MPRASILLGICSDRVIVTVRFANTCMMPHDMCWALEAFWLLPVPSPLLCKALLRNPTPNSTKVVARWAVSSVYYRSTMPVLDRYRYADGIFLLETKGNTITCKTEEESWTTLPISAWISGADGSATIHFRRSDMHRDFAQGSESKVLFAES
ncbi:hypothetical protein OG21DRAFT_974367 [Imleria badia]|nr:hypothetical protein OG21DRAFT_974367 [Imleria badia]